MNRASKKRRAKMRTERVRNERLLAALGGTTPLLNQANVRDGYSYVPMLCGGWELRKQNQPHT